MSNKLISRYSFTMPEIGGTVTLTVSNCASVSQYCWIWNVSVGYLEVIDFKDSEVTVKNNGRIENAKAGAEFPSCMEFLIVAPDSLPLYDTTVTCLSADFRSPAVDATSEMVVEDTSNIRVTDILIIDRNYRYTVVDIIDEHRLEVRNEGWGKEAGEIIYASCDTCTTVKILESTYCCKVVREELQEEIDDIYDRINSKKSIWAWHGNNLVTVSGGQKVLTDAPTDTIIKVDDDLSVYDNSKSKFITLEDIPRGDITSNSSNITVNNGVDAALKNVALTLHTGSVTSPNGTLNITNGNNAALKNMNVDVKTGNLTVTSTNGELTISSGSGSAALLKDLNIDLDLSAYAPSGDIPSVGNGRLTIQDSNGTPLGTFTANQSGNSVITLPAAPTPPGVPSQYSGQIKSEYNNPVNYTLQNTATSGAPVTRTQPLSSDFPTITLASPVVSGHNITVFGTVFVMVMGEFHTDTHTYSDQKYHSFVTVRGPTTELSVMPVLNSDNIYLANVTSGKAYHIATDVLGTTSADRQAFSQQVTIPIIGEVTSGDTITLSFTGSISAEGLRDAGGTSSQSSTFYNESVRVFITRVKTIVALGWIVK